MLVNPVDIKNILRHYGLKPKDYFGQNFLVDELALEEIVNAGDVTKKDTVLEIGPGLGNLTELLAVKAGKVVAVEKDRGLMPILEHDYKDIKNVRLINEDILSFNFDKELKGSFKIIANIPYYLTSKLIQNILALKNKPELIVLLIQKEVGERIVAGPGELSILGISVQFFADAEIVASVPAKSFWPAPKVDSVVITIRPKKNVQDLDLKLFFRIIKIAFAGKRKQITNSLTNGLHVSKDQVSDILKAAKIEPIVRPQDLSLDQWVTLYQTVKNKLKL